MTLASTLNGLNANDAGQAVHQYMSHMQTTLPEWKAIGRQVHDELGDYSVGQRDEFFNLYQSKLLALRTPQADELAALGEFYRHNNDHYLARVNDINHLAGGKGYSKIDANSLLTHHLSPVFQMQELARHVTLRDHPQLDAEKLIGTPEYRKTFERLLNYAGVDALVASHAVSHVIDKTLRPNIASGLQTQLGFSEEALEAERVVARAARAAEKAKIPEATPATAPPLKPIPEPVTPPLEPIPESRIPPLEPVPPPASHPTPPAEAESVKPPITEPVMPSSEPVAQHAADAGTHAPGIGQEAKEAAATVGEAIETAGKNKWYQFATHNAGKFSGGRTAAFTAGAAVVGTGAYVFTHRSKPEQPWQEKVAPQPTAAAPTR